eukprot:CAMPEP_0117583936 /NCGR_PEP_ID=MMETSP0784-20121206/67306_1 /TAXON_ID=39447 /ORGANISM="" /LENGTH=57 /DNA_ID=CAMNT_0005384707 /DNA_START=128 /DNA_END=298 /DNA_ORIENTATION=+
MNLERSVRKGATETACHASYLRVARRTHEDQGPSGLKNNSMGLEQNDIQPPIPRGEA